MALDACCLTWPQDVTRREATTRHTMLVLLFCNMSQNKTFSFIAHLQHSSMGVCDP